jgi:hypothetical protein
MILNQTERQSLSAPKVAQPQDQPGISLFLIQPTLAPVLPNKPNVIGKQEP